MAEGSKFVENAILFAMESNDKYSGVDQAAMSHFETVKPSLRFHNFPYALTVTK